MGRTTRCLIPLCALILVPATACMQAAYVVDPRTGAVVVTEDPVSFEPEIEQHRLDVDFDGLVLADIVEHLRKVPEFSTVNFVVSPKLNDFGQETSIHVKLRAVGLRDILNAVEIATDDQVTFKLRTPTLVAVLPGNNYQTNPEQTPLEPIAEPPSYQVLNLRDLLKETTGSNMDEIMSNISDLVSQTLQTIHGHTRLAPTLNYHPGSGILVIVGQPIAIRITTDIIRNLQRPQRSE